MSTIIEDNGNLLDITIAGEKHSLPKSSIELNVWNGNVLIWSFMRERYQINYTEVTSPVCVSAEDLRDKIADIINTTEQDETSANVEKVNIKMYNANDKFDIMIEELMEIKKLLKKIYA